jgi:uncharacterized membrane protein
MADIELKPTEYRLKGLAKVRRGIPEAWWGRFAVATGIWTGAVLALAAEISGATGIMPGWVIISGVVPPYALWLYAALFTD